jgi:pullulanase/glycogen debranching enzyme
MKVILDVVYNHTGEGNQLGPSLAFRGLDNPSYYSLTGPPAAPLRYYMPSRERFDRQSRKEPLCVQLDSNDGAHPKVQRLFFIFNAHVENRWVKLPPLAPPLAWHRAIDTSLPAGDDFTNAGSEVRIDPPDHYIANRRSTVALLAQ